MRKLADAIGENYTIFEVRLKILIFSFLIIVSVLLVLILSWERHRIFETTNILLEHNISTSIEEVKVLSILENFDNNISVNVSENGDICGPFNCYKVSFQKLYLKYLKIFSAFFAFCIVLLVVLVRTRSLLEESLREQFLKFKKLISGDKLDEDLVWSEFVILQKMMEEREKLKQRDYELKSLSHDMKSPLAALHLLTNLKMIADKEGEELLVSAVERLEELLESNISLDSNNESFDFCTISEIKKIAGYLKQLFPSLKFIISDNLGPHNSTTFYNISKAKFNRIIENLLKNSCEALHGHLNPTIEISIAKKCEALVIDIRDNGKGFPSELLESGPIDGMSIGKLNGTGIGLHSIKKMLDKAGGDLNISNLHRGASVELKIPVLA
ncbi:MAG: hypothetical protein CME65_04400 [Halobacteriovoraceae bacterium]|nr:hypothetical protein [Halobacteriovoraceae bacterium]|tara:strand:- start:4373 stop:5527 length:1155 start_codon:yes stop_codon:yes gene_type:complete